ncbi:MAG: hypothetical protein ACK4SZ_03455 [Allosphingosinicella sp.]
MARSTVFRRPRFAGAEGMAMRGAHNRYRRNAAVAAADKLIHPRA